MADALMTNARRMRVTTLNLKRFCNITLDRSFLGGKSARFIHETAARRANSKAFYTELAEAFTAGIVAPSDHSVHGEVREEASVLSVPKLRGLCAKPLSFRPCSMRIMDNPS